MSWLLISAPLLSCYGGLGRSGLGEKNMSTPWTFYSSRALTSPALGSHGSGSSVLLCHTVAACLLLQLSVSMTVNQAIEILREHRGGGAIQTVKVFNPFRQSDRERSPSFSLRWNHVSFFLNSNTTSSMSSGRSTRPIRGAGPESALCRGDLDPLLKVFFFFLLWCTSNMHLLVIAL